MSTSKELTKKNSIYANTYEQMLSYQLAYLGGLDFKMHVRKKRPSEDSTLWIDLVNNTIAQPICRYVVDTINDVLFEPGIKRNMSFATPTGTYINPNNTEWSDLFLLDCDLQNRSMNSFMENVGDMASIFGYCWLAVDMPQSSEGNLGRPYVVSISPLDVWDWEWEYFGGKPMLKYVKIKEGEDELNWYFKCYHLGSEKDPSYWVGYTVNKNVNKNQVTVTGKGEFPLGMSLPVFIAYGRRDPRTIDIGISDIDSASDAQREHYKLECEAYTSIQFAKTIVRADKGISIPVHAGAIVRATEGQVEAIAVSTQDVDQIIQKQEALLEQIEGLIGIGGIRNSKNQIASGVAIIEERKQLHRIAKSKARLMEVAEQQIFTYAARFMDMRWAGTVNYNTDYEATDSNYRLALMTKAKELVQDNEIINALISKEIIAMLAPSEDIPEYEQAYIDGIEDQKVKDLMTKTNQQVLSRDLGSQIPTAADFGETAPTPDGSEYEDDGANQADGSGATITDTGTSYYPQQAVAAQLLGSNTGR